MKKQHLKNLHLNKKSISDLGRISIQGGAVTGDLCAKDTKQNGDCWTPTIMQTFNCPATATRCVGGADCVRPGD